MSAIAWADLIRLGLVDLRLRPDEFWGLTPGELMLMAGAGEEPRVLTREGLEALAARFPDQPKAETGGWEREWQNIRRI